MALTAFVKMVHLLTAKKIARKDVPLGCPLTIIRKNVKNALSPVAKAAQKI